MNFNYKARDPLGKIIEAQIEAFDRDEASQLLVRDGFEVIRLDEDDDGYDLFPRRIRKTDVIYATSQLAIMVDTGISLATALEGLAEQEENPTLKKLLQDLRLSVEGGEDFSKALSRHPRHFDTTYVALVRASEQTGSLGAMLERIANYLREELDHRGKVRAALAYPMVMATLAIGVTIFLLTYVMPQFAPLFDRKGVKLPTPTKLMMAASDLMVDYWYVWLLLSVGLTVGYFVGRRTNAGRKSLDWLRIHLPVVGTTMRKVIISRSIRTLGTMVESGVSMLDAIHLTAEVSGNHYYRQAWLHVVEEITQGNRICQALRGNPLFPSTLVQMIGSGEETGKLDYVLEKVSVYYDREVESSLKTTTSLIEPLMITVMGVVVGGIGLSILLPIFSLSRAH